MTTQSNSHLLWEEEVRAWLSVDGSGDAHVFEAGDCDIVRRTGITLHYVRRILHNHPLFTILARERAIVINVEAVQAIITANEVLLRDPSFDTAFVQGLQTRIRNRDTTTTQFEFAVLEACLEAVCDVLEDQKKILDQEAHTYKLKSNTITEQLNNLEGLYKLKTRLIDITNRVQVVKERLESFLYDESNMDTYSTANDKFVVKELKMLLEAYYFQILSILNKLSKEIFRSHGGYIVATLFTAILVLLAYTVVTSIFRLYIASYDPRLFGTKAYFCYVGGCIARVIFLYWAAIAWWKQKRKLE